jgi:hypothetical protein
MPYKKEDMMLKRSGLLMLCVFLHLTLFSIGNANVVNLANRPTTTAIANQSDSPNYLALKAIDNDTSTYWRAISHGTPTDPKWLVVDLGNVYKVDHIELWGQDSPEYQWYYIDYKLMGSIDGSNFTLLSIGTLTDPATVNPPTQEYYDYFYDNISVASNMRYVKFEVIGGTHDAHLNEIKIWGESTPVACGRSINYANFSDLSALTLGPRAQQLNPNENNILKLISGTWQRGGYASLPQSINVSSGYSTHFSFQITNLIDEGADWLWFIVSGQPFDVMVADYETVPPIIVEFDIFNNGARDNYDGNHIGLYYDGQWMVVQPVSTSFKNGAVWNVWIDYDGSIMNIYASMDSVKPISPYVTHSINVPGKIDTSQAYIGFWAASGADGADFSILQWSLTTPLLPGDFVSDGDVDGSDLAAMITNSGLLDIIKFAQNFGKDSCQ